MSVTTVSQRVDTQQSHVMYNGTVHLDFDPVKHRYKINGDFANGVTTALSILAKPQLIYWSANMAADYVKERLVPGEALDEIQIQELCAGAKKAHLQKRDGAADMGTYIHNWIEAYVRGENPKRPVNDRLNKVIDDFLHWWDKTDIEPLSPEQMFCSPTYNLAGTADLLCRVDGKLTIMDWKTGSGIYPEMFLQLAAYALMYEEEHPDEKIEQLYVVNASIKNMFQTECRTEVDFYKKMYLQALELYRSSKDLEAIFKNK